MSRPNILMAVPAYGGSNKTPCTRTLLDLQYHFIANGISCRFDTVNTPDVVVARNYLASRFLADASFTHLLFVDADISAKPVAFSKLLEANKPIIGGVYPKRELDLRRLAELLKDHPFEVALSLASTFTFGFLRDSAGARQLNVVNGIAEVDFIGMGACLIQCRVFTELAANGKIPRRLENGAVSFSGEPLQIFGFFDRIADRNPPLEEDRAFCERWRSICGGKVYAHVDLDIDHTGEFTFTARYRDRLKGGQI